MNKENSSENCIVCGVIGLNDGIPPIANDIMITGVNCTCKYNIHLQCFAEWCKLLGNNVAASCLVCYGPAIENPGMINRRPAWLLHDVRYQTRLERNILMSILRECKKMY